MNYIVKNIASAQDMIKSIQPRFAQAPAGLDQEITETRNRIVNQLEKYAESAKEPAIFLGTFQKSGSQWIADFSVGDKAKPVENKYNWHMQNTSQWLFAGAIVYDERDKRLSVHT